LEPGDGLRKLHSLDVETGARWSWSCEKVCLITLFPEKWTVFRNDKDGTDPRIPRKSIAKGWTMSGWKDECRTGALADEEDRSE
jgi:hypothetical protein